MNKTPNSNTPNNTPNWFQDQFIHRISFDPSKIDKIDKKEAIKHLSILCYVIIATVILFVQFLNNPNFASNPYTYVSNILFFTIIGFAIYYFLFRDIFSNKRQLMYSLFAMLIFGIVCYFYFNLSFSFLYYVNLAIYGVVGLMIIVALAMVYRIYSQKILKMQGAAGFWIQLLFYLPCLFAIWVEYIKNEFAITPSVVYILLFIEILLIAAYFAIPRIVRKINKMNTNVVRMEPIQLNKESVVANSDVFLISGSKDSPSQIKNYKPPINNPTDLDDSAYRNNQYAIAFWVFINPSSPSNEPYVKENTIFDCAGGKPKLTFVNKGNQNYFVAYFSNRSPENSKHEIVLPTQKWNYFVFNYTNGQVDLFVNGNLEKNMSFLEDNVPLNTTEMDTIKVGSTNGLNGYVCNINYYPEPMKASTISYNYNLLMMKNPPTIRL